MRGRRGIVGLFILLVCCGYGCYAHKGGHAAGDEHEHHSHTSHRINIAVNYLKKYGYSHPDNLRGRTVVDMRAELRNGILRFQTFANLPRTGVMDDATTAQMKVPRCGVEDPPITLSPSERVKRFAIKGSKWRKRILTWRLVGRSRNLKRDTIRTVMKKACGMWSKVANIQFKETRTNKVDMWIQFYHGYHGDGKPFKGEGGALAHAFYPMDNRGIAGDLHFDDAENFVYKSKDGYDLLHTAVHEIGHALGLDHSRIKGSIMFPWLPKGSYKKNLKLTDDDVRGLSYLYGAKTSVKPTRPPLKTCPRNFFTAYVYLQHLQIGVGITDSQQIYMLKKDGGIRAGPFPVSRYFPKRLLRGKIDAAFGTYKITGQYRHYFFVGKTYYVYRGLGFRSGPHSIHNRYEKDNVTKTPLEIVMPDWVTHIDAVFTWSDGRTYFFYKQWVWRFNYVEKRFDRGYPRIITTAWKGAPATLHAALTTKDGTPYFVSRSNIYKLDTKEKKVAKGYPRYVGDSKWLNCKKG